MSRSQALTLGAAGPEVDPKIISKFGKSLARDFPNLLIISGVGFQEHICTWMLLCFTRSNIQKVAQAKFK